MSSEFSIVFQGQTILSGGTSRSLSLWDLRTPPKRAEVGEPLPLSLRAEAEGLVDWRELGHGAATQEDAIESPVRRFVGHTNSVFCLDVDRWPGPFSSAEEAATIGGSGETARRERTGNLTEGVVVSGSGDGDTRLWDLGSGRCCWTMSGHDDAVYGVRVKKGRVVSASADTTVR